MDVNILNEELFEAVKNSDIITVRFLIEQGADVNFKNHWNFSVLGNSIDQGSFEIAELLISKGADKNDGLHYAVAYDRLKILEFLLNQEGADVNHMDERGHTVLEKAVLSGSLDIVKLVVSKGANPNDGLHSAAENGKLEKLEFLLSQGADVNHIDELGRTVLDCTINNKDLYSAFNNIRSLNIVKLLISKGANPNDGLHSAVITGRLEILEFLLSQGADVNHKNSNGETALETKGFSRSLDIVKLLVSKGANPNEGLHSAAELENLEVVEFLLSQGADVNHLNKLGRTVLDCTVNNKILYSAYNNRSLDIVKLLISRGADINHKNSNGETALEIALDKNKLDIAKLLIEEGIKIENSVFSHLKACKDFEFIKYIIEHIKNFNVDNFDLLELAIESAEHFKYVLDLGMNIHKIEAGEEIVKQAIAQNVEVLDFDQAEMISKLSGITLNHKDMISNIANTLTNDLAKSQELYKYHAVIHLFEKAGITIPESIAKYVNDPKNYNSDDFPCIEGYIPSLVKKYALIAKENMIEKFGAGNVETNNIIDNLFNPPASYSEEFNKLNQLIKNPISTIDTEFEAYHYIVNEIMSKISNDYHLEMLAISGVQPQIIPETVTVFRGIKADLSDSQIESIFTYGHKAYNDAEYNALGYHSKHEWKSFSHASWEYGGTYVSLEAAHSIGFAGGNGILLEMDLPKGSPMICGRNTNECELIPNLKESGDIKAIYKLDGNLIVANLYVNPYYTPKDDKEFSLSFKEDDNAHNVAISKKEEYIKAYNNLECKIHEKNFKDYDHFIETHTSDKVQAIRDENYKNFGTITNDNLQGECTLYGVFDHYQMCEMVA